jgi:hypothetical protein
LHTSVQIFFWAWAAVTQTSSQAPQQQYGSALQMAVTHSLRAGSSESGPPVTQVKWRVGVEHAAAQTLSTHDLLQQSALCAQNVVEHVPAQTPPAHVPTQQSPSWVQALASATQAGAQKKFCGSQ